MAIDYKIIKYCINCKQRFVVKKGQSLVRYCDDCKNNMEVEA
jgi:hypothetical protein